MGAQAAYFPKICQWLKMEDNNVNNLKKLPALMRIGCAEGPENENVSMARGDVFFAHLDPWKYHLINKQPGFRSEDLLQGTDANAWLINQIYSNVS